MSHDLDQRLYRGGLPPFLLADAPAESDFQEWMEAYWAKDIQELIRLERRHSFLRFVELLLAAPAAHLVEHVFPQVPVRHVWVVTFSRRLRRAARGNDGVSARSSRSPARAATAPCA